MGTDRDWERWGAGDPYFGVLSEPRFRLTALGDKERTEFFVSGDAHVASILAAADRLFGVEFLPQTVLDFGCGVGRLVIPFARRAQRVVGVDVSASMLAEARHNCDVAGIRNVALVGSDDQLSQVEGEFDLVHSYIVMQHIPWRRGRRIMQALACHVAPRGVLAVQVLARSLGSPLVRGLVRLRYVFPPANWLRNVLRGRPVFEQAMQLHVYDTRVIVRDLELHGFACQQLATERHGFHSVTIYARRTA